jgi:hypothetical protein
MNGSRKLIPIYTSHGKVGAYLVYPYQDASRQNSARRAMLRRLVNAHLAMLST